MVKKTARKATSKKTAPTARKRPSGTPKNIFVCCDGTNNQIEEAPSNVYRLFTCLEDDGDAQVAFYDPGVGTLPPPDIRTPIRRRLSLAFGLAFGVGLMKNIEEAYRFLMQSYEPGDRIFLIGFSRGAYTVRALAGMIRMFGILHPHQENLIPYLSRSYARKDFKLIRQIKTFTRKDVEIELLGLWDTVSSYGFAWNRQTLPYTAKNRKVHAVRHALAIDEKRAYFRQNRWGDAYLSKQDVKEVWFPGVHSDVGGGYPEHESQLARNTLQWMMAEIDALGAKRGFRVHWIPRKVARALGVKPGEHYKGDAGARAHESLRGFWHVLELLPMNFTLDRLNFFLPLGKRRTLSAGSGRNSRREVIVHQSALDRLAAPDSYYAPENLEPGHDGVEPWSNPPCPPIRPKAPGYSSWRRRCEKSLAALAVAFLVFGAFSACAAGGRWLAESSLGKILALFLLPFGVLTVGSWALGVLSGLPRHARRLLDHLRKPPVHLRVQGYDLEDLRVQNDILGTDGVTAYRRMLLLDLLFPLVYTPALIWTFMLAGDLLGAHFPLVVMATLPVAAALADWVENIILLLQTHPDGAPSARVVTFASGATRIKFLAFLLSAVVPPMIWTTVTLWKPIRDAALSIGQIFG